MKIAQLFQSGMILQRNMPITVWGTGKAGEKISISIQGQNAETYVGADQTWKAMLEPLKESYYEVMILQNENEKIEINDVAIGEVFVAAGQSNMEFWMRYEKHYREVLPSCENAAIRFYDVPKLAYDGQEKDFDYHNVGIWRKASKENLEYFSAVGYYFARKLENELSVPVGIIGCNWGGTKSLAWMQKEHARHIQKEQTEAFEEKLGGQSYEEFCKTAGKNPMNDSGNSIWNAFNDFILPRTPSQKEIGDFFSQNLDAGPDLELAKPQDAPGALYQWMVQRLAPYAVRAVLWYQGESDDEIDGTQKNYKSALKTIMADWRALWEDPHLPFLVVQLPGFYSWLGYFSQGFPTIRRCQQEVVLEDEKSWLCSISDAGEEFDIHPKDKKKVGERLALLAQKHLFGQKILADAPAVKNAKREKNRIVIWFEHAEGGLSLSGDRIRALHVVQGGKTIDYTEEFSDERIILHFSGEIEGKLTVRFAQDEWYKVNLYNQAGIPAIPFEISC